MVKAFLKNYLTKYEIGEEELTLKTIGSGISSVDQSTDEDTDDQGYYDLAGGKETIYNSITGAYSFSGHRDYTDEAQEYVREKVYKLNERTCYFQVTEPDGRIVKGPATIGGITPGGGDANNRGDFEFTVTFVGVPTDTTAPII